MFMINSSRRVAVTTISVSAVADCSSDTAPVVACALARSHPIPISKIIDTTKHARSVVRDIVIPSLLLGGEPWNITVAGWPQSFRMETFISRVSE
jgi:hypothetical protein